MHGRAPNHKKAGPNELLGINHNGLNLLLPNQMTSELHVKLLGPLGNLGDVAGNGWKLVSQDTWLKLLLGIFLTFTHRLYKRGTRDRAKACHAFHAPFTTPSNGLLLKIACIYIYYICIDLDQYSNHTHPVQLQKGMVRIRQR